MSNMTEKIILDCDNTMGIPFKEVDDGLTILYLLGVPEIDLLGITTTFGNGTIDQVYTQTLKLSKQLGLDLPVLKGEGARHQSPDTPAAHFMVEMVNKYPHQITLLATGPLGNLNAAHKLDPGFFSKVKRIAAMGGYLKPLKLGYRNLAELNLSANPQAALAVLNAPCPLTLFPGRTCLDAPYRLRDIITATYWPASLKWTMTLWLLGFGLYCGVRQFYLWDLLPAVYLTHPHLFRTRALSIGSTLTDLEKGMLIDDPAGNEPHITIGTKIIDRAGFFSACEKAWKNTCRQ
jgi:inosine-uridine nucleoside N-ribohydrolase